MRRRDFLGLSTAGVLGFLAGCGPDDRWRRDATRRVAAPPDAPDVLFIAVDDLNDWIGCLGGHPDGRTPRIDALAERGTLFTNAHCPSPACNPSRTALLTGKSPITTGLYANEQEFRSVLPGVVTLPAHFWVNGYRAVSGGKVFHRPDPVSWDVHWPGNETGWIPSPLPPDLPANGLPDPRLFDWGPVDVAVEEMGDARLLEWATEQLHAEQAEPLFLGVGFYRPHLPWFVPPEFFEPFPSDAIRLPEVMPGDLEDVPAAGRALIDEYFHREVLAAGQWAAAVRSYLASMWFADTMIGRLLDELDASPRADRTIVVLWSDHGWHLGEKEHWRKFVLWEEATRVPLIVVPPAGFGDSGGRCSRAVSLLDLFPTLTELCGLPTPADLEGSSLVPQLRDPGAARDRPAVTIADGVHAAARDDRWRYIRYQDGSEELYDHASDPNEWTNLAGLPDAEYVEARQALARWLPGRS